MLKKKIDFSKYKKAISRPFNKLMAETLKTGIVERTQGGKDFNSKSFKKYSDEYRDIKGSSNVNLTVSGNMLESIKYDIDASTLKFYIRGNEGKKAHGNQVKNKRTFLGIDKKQKELLKKKIGKFIVNQ